MKTWQFYFLCIAITITNFVLSNTKSNITRLEQQIKLNTNAIHALQQPQPKQKVFFKAPLTHQATAPKTKKLTASAYTIYKDPTPFAKDGYILKNKTLHQARTIAVKPHVIPIGTKVTLEFPKPYTDLNGTYIARDKMGEINNRDIDVYFGYDKSANQEAIIFGLQNVKATY